MISSKEALANILLGIGEIVLEKLNMIIYRFPSIVSFHLHSENFKY